MTQEGKASVSENTRGVNRLVRPEKKQESLAVDARILLEQKPVKPIRRGSWQLLKPNAMKESPGRNGERDIRQPRQQAPTPMPCENPFKPPPLPLIVPCKEKLRVL